MTRVLVATASVHVTAAAADYLEGRLAPEDEVVVVGVREPDAPARDVEDAANVARTRLVAQSPTVDTRDGDPGEVVLAAVAEYDPDEVILGAHAGTPGATGVGSTARSLLAALERPAVVVPVPDLA